MAAGQSRPIDRILNIFVSAAAVPVLLGALFKITHAPGADVWLKIGLWTESVIFLGYALLYVFAPPPEAPMAMATPVDAGNPALKSLDNMLAQADITPVNLKKLSEGFTKLGTTVNNMGEIGDVVKSTGDFNAKTKEATAALGGMATTFTNTTATMASFNKASESSKGAGSGRRVPPTYAPRG